MSEPPETMKLLCVCDEEWCWCSNLIEVEYARILESVRTTGSPPDVSCEECRAGNHIMEPGAVRSG